MGLAPTFRRFCAETGGGAASALAREQRPILFAGGAFKTMSSRRRIVFLINSLAGGGAERVMCNLLAHSAPECAEFEMILALLDSEPAAYSPPEWVKLRQFDCRFSLPRSVLAVRRLLDEEQPDATLSFLTRANVANVLASRLRGTPAVISERANTSAHFPSGARGALPRTLVRLVYPRADRIVAVSEGVAHDLRDNFAIPEEKLAVIANPVDLEGIRSKSAQWPEIPIDGRYVLGVGRLVKSKNFALLIQAFAASGFPGKLVILGEGPEREALTSLIGGLGLADRVLLPGFVSNPYPIMRRAEIFVLPSNAEGFPNGLVEAMALGIPVISTNCPSGPSELLAERPREAVDGLFLGEHGILAPPGEAAPMASALKSLEDAELRRAYGQKAAIRASAFSSEKAKRRYWEILNAVLRPQAELSGKRATV
jgi:N-acetylgalactosamine-N,N'-diacetylbacillosaminyl-diphospho-undecaprenol 4-alpha-N-acetylgalactosaminyltransferase